MTPGKILLFGANGRLGRALHAALQPRVLPITRKQLDLFVNASSIGALIESFKGSAALVINASAMNGMEACEENPARAFAVNTQAPAAMAAAARMLGIPFVHFSSDYAVTCGSKSETPIDEFSPRAACGLYGTSKLLGEMAINAIGARGFIFRLASIYTSADFAGSLNAVTQFKAGKGTGQEPIKVLRQLTTPTSVRTIVKAVVAALPSIEASDRQLTRTFNLVCGEPRWKSSFATEAVRLFCDAVPRVEESKLSVDRPEFSVLSNTAFQKHFAIKLPTVLEDLQEEARLWKASQQRLSSSG